MATTRLEYTPAANVPYPPSRPVEGENLSLIFPDSFSNQGESLSL